MFEMLQGVFIESVDLFNKMSPYLLFGFFVAGLLHLFVSLDYIANHLGKRGFSSVIKAVILGIPLPLCSCGVIPAAVSLRRKGASRGAVVSFLVATPISGIDSIFATYSLLGFAFTIVRLISSALTAIVAGLLTNLFDKGQPPANPKVFTEHKHEDCCEFHRRQNKIKEMFNYAFVELFGDVWKWLVLGTLVGGAISYFVPASFIEAHLGNSWKAMFIMLAVGIPMYVCATGSIPIAASLMLKGMSPGAGLVFLLAGPATNAVTITVLSKELGKKVTFLYLFAIAATSIAMGMLVNVVWKTWNLSLPQLHMHSSMLPEWVEILSSIILIALIIFSIISRLKPKSCHG